MITSATTPLYSFLQKIYDHMPGWFTKLYRQLLMHPRAILLAGGALLAMGLSAWPGLGISLWPNFDVPRLEVVVETAGEVGLEVEDQYVRPLRQKLAQQGDLIDIQSWATEGRGELHLTYKWGTDMDVAYLRVLEELAQVRFPNSRIVPYVRQGGPANIPILQLQVSDPTQELVYLKEFSEQVLKRRLEQLDGVGNCLVLGGTQAEVVIQLDPNELRLHHLSMAQVKDAISAQRS